MLSRISAKTARVLAVVFLLTTLSLGGVLGWTWFSIRKLALAPIPDPALPAKMRPTTAPVSPLQLQYQVNLPGRGEIFPALAGGKAVDYWPVAVLSIANTSSRPVLQVITAQVNGWTEELRETAVIGPNEVRTFNLDPQLLPDAYQNEEIRQANLRVEVKEPVSGHNFAEQRPVFVHSASDLFWGGKFANAQLVARWVTPHDPGVLQLVSHAERIIPGGRLRGYNGATPAELKAQVTAQAEAVFQALRQSRISYVSSIYTFGNYPGETQRIRLPRETLVLNNANCIDVSVLFASAMENLGLRPVVVIVPGHAFAGVRLDPLTEDILYIDLTVLPTGSFRSAIKRAQGWLERTPKDEILNVDIGAARSLGVYPMPTSQGVTKPAVTTSSL